MGNFDVSRLCWCCYGDVHQRRRKSWTSCHGAVNWTNIQGAPSGAWGVSAALTADGKTVLWRTSNGQVVYSVNGAAFVPAGNGLPTDSKMVADRKNTSRIYAVSGASVYLSESSIVNFTLASKFSSTVTYNNDRGQPVHNR